MRYGSAVTKIRRLAEACETTKRMPLDEPFLREAYVFGDVLNGADGFDVLEVALVLTLPPEEVPWRTNPQGTEWVGPGGEDPFSIPFGSGKRPTLLRLV